MKITSIRMAISDAIKASGYANSKGWIPEDPKTFPAALVDIPRSIEYGESLGLALLEIPVTLVFSLGSGNEDAQKRMDAAMSTEAEDGEDLMSIKVALDAAKSPLWRTIRVMSVENPRIVKAGNSECLAVDFIVAVYTPKNYNG